MSRISALRQTEIACEIGARAGRAGAARRRRARRLPGRRLSGAARGRHRARLGDRHLDRRHQRQPDRRQRARPNRWNACANSGSGWSSNPVWSSRDAARLREVLANAVTVASGFPASSGRTPGAVPAIRLSARRRQCRLLFDRAAGEDADRAGRLPARQQARRASRSAPPTSAPARCAISTAAMAISASVTSWRQARCRRRSRRSASTASSTGTAASFRTRRWRRCSTTSRARNSLVFAVHLGSARRPSRQRSGAVLYRQKDLQYSSRIASHIARQKQTHDCATSSRARRAPPESSASERGERARRLRLPHPDARRAPALAAAGRRGPHQGHRLQPRRHQAPLGRRLPPYQIGT